MEEPVYGIMPVAIPVSAHLAGLVRIAIRMSMIVFKIGAKMEPRVWMRSMDIGEQIFVSLGHSLLCMCQCIQNNNIHHSILCGKTLLLLLLYTVLMNSL